LISKHQEGQATYRYGLQIQGGGKCSDFKETTLSTNKERFLMLQVVLTMKAKISSFTLKTKRLVKDGQSSM